MSSTDFQERLRRISANAGDVQRSDPVPPQGGQTRRRKVNYKTLGFGGALFGGGLFLIRYANENYEALRASSDEGLAATLGLAGMASFVIGLVIILWASVRPYIGSTGDAANETSPVRREASGRARFVWSLVGFLLGSIASFYMFVAGAAKYVGTEKAQVLMTGSIVIAFGLAAVALLFGLIALFMRGRALGRVPVYFILGGALTYAAFRIGGVNLLEWPQLMAQMQ